LPAVLNAANELAVEAFCQGKLRFDQISALVARVMDQHTCVAHPELTQILQADAWARHQAQSLSGAL
jgi:1-deoxy-D-xylulose-5-phosphate reductoisomerase